MISVTQITKFENILKEQEAVFVYFSHDKCSVCKTLKPKLEIALKEEFPKLTQIYVDIEKYPEIAGQYNIFTVPVILVFFEGKESFRKTRNVGVNEMVQLIQRPYSILFIE